MSATHSSSVSKPFGVARVCRAWELARSTFYDWRKRLVRGAPTARRGPKPLVPDEALAGRIRAIHGDLEREHGIRGEGYRKTHARLRSEGVRTSRHRVLRIMRENALLSPTRVGRARGPHVNDGRILTEVPDDMWGTDATTAMTLDEGSAWVFAAVDHCTGELVGIHASRSGSRYEALEPVNQGVRERFGPIDAGVAAGLAVRHDLGAQYTSRAFQDQLAFLGVESSPSFVRSPEGNGVAERCFRTLKEQLLWVRSFPTIEELDGLRLELHPQKTKLVELGVGKEGFDFQGCPFRLVRSVFRGRVYLFRWPSHRAMNALRARVRELTNRRRWAGMKDIRDVIAVLNPLLVGWGSNFRTGNASKHFNSVDRFVTSSSSPRVRHLTARPADRRARGLAAPPCFHTQWPHRRFVDDFGLHQLLGTIRYPGGAHAT